MHRWRICLALLGLLCAAEAKAYDPRLTWWTLHTSVARVHFPRGYYEQALAIARSTEAAWPELTQRLGYEPETPFDIVLSDETDSANGFAQTLPYSLVGLNAVAPDEVSELSDYEDWTYGLVVHELAHIVHINTVLGLPATLNTIFGRWIFPNGAQPRWFTEGLATYFESTLTTKGRVRSAFFDMQLRMDVLSRQPLGLDDVSGMPLSWPQGTTPYLYGSYFLDFVARHYGEGALRRISFDYGGRLLPYALNLSAKNVLGQAYPDMYERFLTELSRRFDAQRDGVLANGRVSGTPLTRGGQNKGPARVTRDGTLYFVDSPIDAHTVLKRRTPLGREEVVTRLYAGAELAVTRDGAYAYATQEEMFDWYYSFGDLYRIDLRSGAKTKLTSGVRARGVDVSADGTQLVFVALEGLHATVRLASVDAPADAETLVDLGELSQAWSPRFSPDARHVVFAGFRDGARDIFLVNVASRELVRLTHDVALDGAPTFSADGRYVLFHSDRGGIFNIYALDLGEERALRRVTNVIGGAFRPEVSSAGDALYFQSYDAEGFEITRLSLGELGLQPLADPPAEKPMSYAARALAAPTVFRVTSYSPTPTLLPRNWAPIVGFDARGTHVGASTSGRDALGRHAYALSADYATLDDFVSMSIAYQNATFHPGLGVYLTRTPALFGAPGRDPQTSGIVEQDVWAGGVRTSVPLVRMRELGLSLQPSYELEYRTTYRTFTEVPLDRTRFPDAGRFARLGLGLYFSNALRYTDSISSEEGVTASLVGRVEGPFTGSTYASTLVVLGVSGFLENPVASRHVLALSATLGLGTSSYQERGLFSVGGASQRDVLLDLVSFRFSAPPALRGFSAVSYQGDVLAAGTCEYRFPLWDPEQGVGTLPVYLRTLSAAAFLDAAAVSFEPDELLANDHYSAGLELRASVLLGYALPLMARLGYGQGLFSDEHLSGLYFFVGGAP